MEGGDFTWEAGSSEASLTGVTFSAAPGSLTMVVGSVGSGKSSVLSALIGQMERVKGSVAVGGRVAYVAQSAWIVNDSVQVPLELMFGGLAELVAFMLLLAAGAWCGVQYLVGRGIRSMVSVGRSGAGCACLRSLLPSLCC